jgi:GNAT superfamily N-acetyltransferase
MNSIMDPTGIRRADSGDIPLLTGIIRRSFQTVAERFGLTPENCPKHPSNCSVDWIERDLSRGVQYFILENDGNPAGCAAMEHAPGACYLERLAVLPEERGKGYGLALVRHILMKAEALGAGEVGIGIIAAQTDLKEWYEKIGFIAGDIRDFPHLPFRVLFMSCPLSAGKE